GGGRLVDVGRAAAALAQGASLLDGLLALGRLLVARARVARRELQALLRRHAALQLAAALELRVELGAEQEREVRQPEPQEEDDDARESAVRGAVAAEAAAEVEAEPGRREHPHEDREDRTRAHPAERGLLDVGSEVVEQRDE